MEEIGIIQPEKVFQFWTGCDFFIKEVFVRKFHRCTAFFAVSLLGLR